MTDKMLQDAAIQPSLDEIVKAAISHGVEDAPNAKNEMRHKRIASMVRALFAERYQAAQSVAVVGEAASGQPHMLKQTQIRVGNSSVGWIGCHDDTVRIPAAELEALRKDAGRLQKDAERMQKALSDIAEWTDRYTTPGHPIAAIARAAIAGEK